MGTIHPPFYRWQEKLGHKQGSVGDQPRGKPQLPVRAEQGFTRCLPCQKEAWVTPSFQQMTLRLGLICPLFLALSLCSFSYQLRMTPALPPTSLLPFSAQLGLAVTFKSQCGEGT